MRWKMKKFPRERWEKNGWETVLLRIPRVMHSNPNSEISFNRTTAENMWCFPFWSMVCMNFWIFQRLIRAHTNNRCQNMIERVSGLCGSNNKDYGVTDWKCQSSDHNPIEQQQKQNWDVVRSRIYSRSKNSNTDSSSVGWGTSKYGSLG